MTEKTKIKQLLDSTNPGSQKLGCSLAHSILGWSNTEIWDYLLNSMGGVTVVASITNDPNLFLMKYINGVLYTWDLKGYNDIRMVEHTQGDDLFPRTIIYRRRSRIEVVNRIYKLYEIDLIN